MVDVTEKPSLRIVRRFEAAPGKVWTALTNPDALMHWMGPTDEWKCPIAETDVRIGGSYRLGMLAPDGASHIVSGVYLEVVPYRKLVYTWAWRTTPDQESLVTIELRAVDGGTELTLLHENFHDLEVRKNHNEGWNGCFGRMNRHLAGN